MDHKQHLEIRVYYEDTDCGGVVYHSQYLNFFERGRTEWLRAQGYMQSELAAQDILFAVSRLESQFRVPARFDDLLVVQTRLEKLGRASMQFNQQLLRKGKLLCSARVTVACLKYSTFKPTGLPKNIYEQLAACV